MYFTHLHVHSHYSLLDGLSKPGELLERAKVLGLDSLALTDHGVMYGAIEFYQKAKQIGIKPIIGCELYLAPRSLNDKVSKVDTNISHFLVLAKNITGYQNLLKLVTIGELEGFYYKPRVDKEVLRKYSEGLIASSACLRGDIPQALLSGNLDKARELAREYEDIFGAGNFYLELQDHPELEEQNKVNTLLLRLGKELNIPAIVTCDTHYSLKEQKDAQDVLLAVQTGAQVDDKDRLNMKNTDLYLKSPEEVEKDFSSHPELFENIKKIVEQCNLELDLGKVILPKIDIPGGKDPFTYLKKITQENLVKIYSSNNKVAKSRLDSELAVIKKTGFADYFLIVHDFIRFTKEHGILTNTRGSAAGSLVAYVLGITSVDPLKYDLYFERFLNIERIQPPDIDLDIADKNRSELIHYIEEKYGRDHVAQLITFGIMKSRMAVRDVTRAMGYPYALGDKISKLIPFNFTLKKALSEVPELKELYRNDSSAQEIINMAKQLEGVARHASTHAAGVVISRLPLVHYTPLQHSSRDQKEVITQYDMYSLEKVGLLKMDILGLSNLSVIKNALRIVKKVYDKDIDLEKIEYDDKKVYQLLAKGETVGIFQLESAGMRKYIQMLEPACFEDISAMLALYRPGPMQFIQQFINRKKGKEKITYLHPKLKPILESTYGICVYQEQLMRIAHDLAGFSMGEADILRKAVGKKKKLLLETQKEKLFQGMVKNGIKKTTAERIWTWVEPFARYGFNKGHSTSYARVTYITAWLKAHYPSAFMAALLTSDFGNLDRIAIEINECRRLGVKVLPPSVNTSFAEFGINKENDNIYFSLSAIKNVGTGVALIIQEERQAHGPYKSLTDFLKRVPYQSINRRALESLIKVGALDCFAPRELLEENLEKIIKWSRDSQDKNNQQMGLFGKSQDEDELLSYLKRISSASIDKQKRMNWEREYLGLYLTVHPLDGYKKILKQVAPMVSQLKPDSLGKRIRVCGFISRIQKIRTKIGKPMVFTRLADRDESIEVVLYPAVLANYSPIIQQDKVVMVEGTMNERNGQIQIIGERLESIVSVGE